MNRQPSELKPRLLALVCAVHGDSEEARSSVHSADKSEPGLAGQARLLLNSRERAISHHDKIIRHTVIL